MLRRADALLGEARRHMQSFALHLYIGAVFEAVSEANRYFANSEPWKLAKSDPARTRLVLFATLETLRISAILFQAVMPGLMRKLLDLLAVDPARRTFADADGGGREGKFAAANRLSVGVALPSPVAVFPRYVESETA